MPCMSFQLFGVVITCCLISLIKSFSFIGLSTIPFTGGLFPLLNLTSVTWARALAKISRNSARPIWWWWCCWCWWRWRCCGTHQAWFDDDNVGDNYIDCCDNDDDDDDDVELTTPGSIANSAWTAAALKAITACKRFNRCTRDHSSYNNDYDDHVDANSEYGVGDIADQDDDHFVLHLICAIRSEFPRLKMVLNTISIQRHPLFNREYFSHQLFFCWLYMFLLVYIVQGQQVVWKSNLEGEVWKAEGWQAKDPKMHCLAKYSTIMMKLTIKVWWSRVRDETPDKWSKKFQKVDLMSMRGKTDKGD